MNTYTLTASAGFKIERIELIEDNDTDAIFAAIAHILDTAAVGPNRMLWARGEIILFNQDGEIIKRMEAKEEN